MPELDKCILGKAEAGKVKKSKARSWAEQYREQVEAEKKIKSEAEAQSTVENRILSEAERYTERKKRMALKQAEIQRQILEEIEKYKDVGVDKIFYARMSNDPRERTPGIPDLESRTKNVRGQIHKAMTDFLEAFRSKNAGLTRDTANLYNVVRELYEESTGNQSARSIARGIWAAQDLARNRFNAAGGDIAIRQDFGLTIGHSQSRVARVTRDEWVDYVSDLLDRDKMLDSSGRPMGDEQLRSSLNEAYDSIASGGLVDHLGQATQYSSSVNARAAKRFLSFKNADAWITYHERFGDGNVFNHVVGTFDGLARDIAALEILGPYPEATLRFMEAQLDKAAA